jgi:hypothetical protein
LNKREKFSRTVTTLVANQPGQFNPMWGKVTPCIMVKNMEKIYGEKRGIFNSMKKSMKNIMAR